MKALEIENLIKRYGDIFAVRNLTFSIEEGDIYGFCGPNGAGKTTTLKILVGLVFPTSGTAKVYGKDVVKNSVETRRTLGYLPEMYGLPRNKNVGDFLFYVGKMFALASPEIEEKTDEILEVLGISRYKNRKIKELSKGFKQKVAVAQAFVGNPKILLLDEPTIGLDPKGRNEVLQIMKDFSSREKTILFSTHILSDVEKVCNRVGIINEGRIVAEGEIEKLMEEYNSKDIDDVFLKAVSEK